MSIYILLLAFAVLAIFTERGKQEKTQLYKTILSAVVGIAIVLIIYDTLVYLEISPAF